MPYQGGKHGQRRQDVMSALRSRACFGRCIRPRDSSTGGKQMLPSSFLPAQNDWSVAAHAIDHFSKRTGARHVAITQIHLCGCLGRRKQLHEVGARDASAPFISERQNALPGTNVVVAYQ